MEEIETERKRERERERERERDRDRERQREIMEVRYVCIRLCNEEIGKVVPLRFQIQFNAASL